MLFSASCFTLLLDGKGNDKSYKGGKSDKDSKGGKSSKGGKEDKKDSKGYGGGHK
jgi:hypothetical protein